MQDGRRKEGRMSGMAWGHDNKLGFTSLLIYATDIYIDQTSLDGCVNSMGGN